MAKPFKFRYVNEIVGTFVLLVVVVLIAAIILAGRAQEWFIPVKRFPVDFPLEGSLGIQKGAEVQILQTKVGMVEKIAVDEDGRMSAIISVKGDFIRFVREDSLVVVKKRFGVAGDSFIEITEGQGEPLPDDVTLMATKDTELIEIAEQILQQFRETTLPAIESLKKTVDEYGSLAADLRNPEGPLLKMLANIEQITAGLEKGEGTAGQLLRDPAVAKEIEQILAKVNQTLDEVKVIAADLQKTTAKLPPMAETVGGEVKDLPGLVLQTQETIREAERLIEGIQKTWILRSKISQPPSSTIIPASEVRSP